MITDTFVHWCRTNNVVPAILRIRRPYFVRKYTYRRRSFWFRWQQSLIRNQIFWTIKSSCSQIVNHGGDGVQCFSACFSALLLRRFLLIQLNTFMSNVFLVDGRLVILSFCFVQKNCFHCFISFIIFRLPFIISVLAFHQYRTVRSRPSSSLCVLQSVSIF